MTMQDPIADLLTRVRNAQMAGHVSVEIPNSKAPLLEWDPIKTGVRETLAPCT